MPIQIQFHNGAAWAVASELTSQPKDSVIAKIRKSRLAVRIIDTATSEVLVRSLTAPRQVRDRRYPPLPVTFSPAVEPDPFNIQASRVIVKDPGVYPRFSIRS